MSDVKIQKLTVSQPAIPFMAAFEIEAFSILLRGLNKPVRALEWGAGRSTLYFSSRLPLGSSWVAVEHNPDWYRRVDEELAVYGYSDTEVFCLPPDRPFLEGLADGDFPTFRSYLLAPAKLGGKFDLILVDGRARVACMALGWDLLSEDGVMVLHDAWRGEYQEGIPANCFSVRATGINSNGEPASILFMARNRSSLFELLNGLQRNHDTTINIEENIGPVPGPKGRILFLNTFYSGFLSKHYRKNEGLDRLPYWQQKRSLLEECFGDSDFYSAGMRAAGWEADDLILNCEQLQAAWARENNTYSADWSAVLLAQVARFAPDVIYIQDLGLATKEMLQALRLYAKLIAGQIASPLPPHADISGIDILFSSFPHFVDKFRESGKTSYYQPLAFEPRLLKRLPALGRDVPASFVGGISPHHGKGLENLEQIAAQLPLDVWGYGAESLPSDSPLLERHHGEVWGLEMFQALKRSRIAINRHIDVAASNANNMRLFEATGCGALLLTDYRDNLHELFEPGKELVAYRSPEEAAALVQYYQRYPEEAEAIAAAGQARTLRDHTYLSRMAQTATILARHLRYRQEQGKYRMPDRISSDYRQISTDDEPEKLALAWKDSSIPAHQRALVQHELAQMYSGDIPAPYFVLADMLKPFARTGMTLLELGCASGYYCEILEYLLGKQISYTGVDYSDAMISMARDYYPVGTFFAADAKCLFFADCQFDAVVSSSVLLHVPNYREHLLESVRVTGDILVLHRLPVCRCNPTGSLVKKAYGVETIEFRFNEVELLDMVKIQGFELVDAREINSRPERDEYGMSYLFRRVSGKKKSNNRLTSACGKLKDKIEVGQADSGFVAKTSTDYLSKIAEIKNNCLDALWNHEDLLYAAPDGMDGTVRPFTWLNAFMLQTIAVLANHGIASVADIIRARTVINNLISSPCYVDNTWTHLMDGSSVAHPALDQPVAESLYYAWKYRADLSLCGDTINSIRNILAENRKVHTGLYSSGYNLVPDLAGVKNNQNSGKWQLNRITYACLSGASGHDKSLEAIIKKFIDNISAPVVLFPDFGWFYHPCMNMWHSFEYGAMVAGGLSLFYPDISGIVNLDDYEICRIKAWNRHIFGMWQRNGYPNWDTVYSSGRLHHLSYWLWALRSLMGMVRSPELCQEPAVASYAKFMLDSAIDTFASMDTWQADPADSVVSGMPFGITLAGIYGQEYNNAKAIGAAKFAMELAVAIDMGIADAESADPGNVWGWNWNSHDLHISTPFYSAASLPYCPKINDGPWNSVADSVQSPGDGLSRIQLPDNGILTSLGGYDLESFSFVIINNGITEINTGSIYAGKPASQRVWVDGILQARDDYDLSIIPCNFRDCVRTMVKRNGANYISEVETLFYSSHIKQTYSAVLTGTAGAGQIIHSFPCRKNVVMDYLNVSGEKTVIWDGVTVNSAGSPAPSECRYIHLKWSATPDSKVPKGILLIPVAANVADGAAVTALNHDPKGCPKRQPDQDRSLLVYLADSMAYMADVSLSYDVRITDGTDSGAIKVYSSGGYIEY